MALDIAGGVRQRLADDATLVAMLATYTPEGGAPAPAIFVDPVPPDFEVVGKPAIVVSEPFGNQAGDDYSDARRDASLFVRLYAKQQGSTVDLLTAAERARELLKFWNTPSFSTGKLEGAFVNGPTTAPTDDPSIEGRLLSVQLLIRE